MGPLLWRITFPCTGSLLFVSLSAKQCVSEWNNVWWLKIKPEVYFNNNFYCKSKDFNIARFSFELGYGRDSLTLLWKRIAEYVFVRGFGFWISNSSDFAVQTHILCILCVCMYIYMNVCACLCALIKSGHMFLVNKQWKHSGYSWFMQPADKKILVTVCLSWATLTTEHWM